MIVPLALALGGVGYSTLLLALRGRVALGGVPGAACIGDVATSSGPVGAFSVSGAALGALETSGALVGALKTSAALLEEVDTSGADIGDTAPTCGPLPIAPYTNTRSVLFDGVDEYLRLMGASNLTGNDPFSISSWFKTSNTITFGSLVANSFPINASGQWDYNILMNAAGRIYWRVKSAGGSVINALTAGSWNDGAWHLAVASWDGSNITLNIDGGSEIVSAPCADRFGTGSQFSIGAFINYTGVATQTEFEGPLDEVAYWGVGFTPAQCVELYSAGVPQSLTIHSAAADLLSWWRMGDASGDSTDSSDPAARIRDVIGPNDLEPINTDGGDIVPDVP